MAGNSDSDFTSISSASDTKSLTDSYIAQIKTFRSALEPKRPPRKPRRLTEIPNLNLDPTFITEITNTFAPVVPARLPTRQEILSVY
ncbi:hypothetical protein ACTXT7_004428 [Hymenolepis weldensis]